MRVLIDTTYLRRAPYSGTAVYLTELIAALDRLTDVDVVTAANPARRAPGGGGAASLASAAAYRRWAHVAHRHAALRADVVICPSETTAADARELWGITPAGGSPHLRGHRS